MRIIILVLFSLNVNAQNFFEWSMPTENGEVNYLLLTQDGYKNLLEPVILNDLGELTDEILLIKKYSIDHNKRINDNVIALNIVNDRLNKIESLLEDIDRRLEDAEIQAISPESEKSFLIKNAIHASWIAKRYNKTNNKRNNFSTKDIAKIFNVSDSGSEIAIAERIFEMIKKYR